VIRCSNLVRLGAVLLAGGASLLAGGSFLLAGGSARADTIRNATATFAGLDKITGRIISFDVAIDETVQFGTLQITPRVCTTRPQTETPLTEGFVEVDEIENAKQAKRIFSGWMFAASPGLHGIEHPVYDFWLKDCKGAIETVATPTPSGVNAPPPPNAQEPVKEPRKTKRTIEPQKPVEPTVESLPPESQPAPSDSLAQPAPAAAPDQGLGAPVEVGPPPGAPKLRKPKVKPPAPVEAAPPADPNAQSPEAQAPGGDPAANPAAEPGAPEVAAPKPKPRKKRKPKPPLPVDAPLGEERIPLGAPSELQRDPNWR
jgi:hypothetical protein